MLDPFVSEMQWSSDAFSLEKVKELFGLPQVVKVKSVSLSLEQLKGLHGSDILVLSSSRNIDVVRATDSLMNEYFIPLDSEAKVEVVWKDYKMFYDHIEELCEKFPANVLVEKDDEKIGIKKGEVLKLRQKISKNGSNYLQCDVQGRPDVEVNIPFSYSGSFKTLGDFTERHVLLTDVVRGLQLPIDVKFVDNKLKMKKVDGSSRYPMGLYNIDGNVRLHEVINYADIVAHRISPDEPSSVLTIPLDCKEVDVLVPTAATRNNSNYKQYCSKFAKEVDPEMMRKLGVEHNHWVVFKDDDEPSSPKQQESSNLVKKKPVVVNKLAITQRPGQHRHMMLSSTSRTTRIDVCSSPFKEVGECTPNGARKNSYTFPRFLTPSQRNDPFESKQETYQSIVRLDTTFQENIQHRVEPVMLPGNMFGHSGMFGNLDKEESLYVSMNRNVVTESMVQEERRKKTEFSTVKVAVQSNVHQSQISSSKLEMLRNRPKLPLPTEMRRTEQASPKLKHSLEFPYDVVPQLNVQADRRNVQQLPAKIKEYTDKSINEWSTKDVSKFLKDIGLDKYVKVFSEKKVDGKALVKLSETDLVRSFKMSNKSHLMKLLKFKEECLKHAVQNDYQTL